MARVARPPTAGGATAAALGALALAQVFVFGSQRQAGISFLQPLSGARSSGTRLSQSVRPIDGEAMKPAFAAAGQQSSPLPLFAMVACAAAALRAQVIRRGKGKPQATSGVRVRKPKNNALRNCSIATFEECTTKQRYEPLTIMYKRRFARPRNKPIQMATRTARKSGHEFLSSGGHQRHARKYRIIDFGRTKRGMFGVIETVEYDPYRNARICLVKYEDGERRYVLHALGFFVGQQIISAADAPIFVGNAMPLDKIPIGTMVHNVELHPGNRGQMARAAGASATVLSRDGKYVTIKLPSSEVRLLHKDCWCTVGKVGRGECQLIKLGKAGKSAQLGWRPHVRGSAKNACDHPHGGGEGRSPVGHKHPMTPYGKCAHGKKTRRAGQPSSKYILIRRKKKSGRPG
ncbi:unnamed protein product [Polarella glacialis]|uniref:Large ribosomal subunit protein uL2m n=2 Tax=Polarella glacialis TaxID=89957 RepID=A0A813LY68_POLGL|nr:unnamed protein product [Polarella glacialis]